ncbi:MAG: hypothetical protein KAR19_03600 [Bacteroidales bacterium]|nr:hypothetical protein [Bacteroidales bacterium]
MELHQELRKWIEAVIKQRSYLISQGLSHKNVCQMTENIDFLRRRLDYFPYATDFKISLLFQQNKQRILSLLPGEGSGNHQKRQVEFIRYESLTRQITSEGRGAHRGFRQESNLMSYSHGGISP